MLVGLFKLLLLIIPLLPPWAQVWDEPSSSQVYVPKGKTKTECVSLWTKFMTINTDITTKIIVMPIRVSHNSARVIHLGCLVRGFVMIYSSIHGLHRVDSWFPLTALWVALTADQFYLIILWFFPRKSFLEPLGAKLPLRLRIFCFFQGLLLLLFRQPISRRKLAAYLLLLIPF